MTAVLALLVLLGSLWAFQALLAAEFERRRQILDRRKRIQIRRTAKLAEISSRRQKRTAVAAGTQEDGAKAAAEALKAMLQS